MAKMTLRNRRFLKVSAVIALAGLLLAALGIIVVYRNTFPGVDIQRVSFSTAPYDDPPRTVSGLLFIPRDPVEVPTPAVVFSHGMLVQKEVYVSHCRELALQGLVVLDIDLRGHGATGGSHDFGNTEMRDVWAAVDYLSQLDLVDPDRIAVAGHSLGGITSTRAGVFQEDDGIKAVVAIYCWPGQKQAIETVFGPLEDFIGNLWPYFGLSRVYDLNDESDTRERDVVSYLDESTPPNYMLIIGDRDELGTLEESWEIMEAATGVTDIERSELYGDFEEGTARMLKVTKDNHLTEATSTKVLSSLTKWIFESFGLEPPEDVNNSARRRFAGMGAVISGFLLIAVAALFLMRAYKREKEDERDIAPYRPDGRRSGVWLGAVAAVLFAAISVAAFPFSRATNIRAFIPFFGADVFTSMVAARTILMIPAVILLYAVIKYKRWNSLPLRAPGPSTYKQAGTSALIGAVPVGVFVVLYAPTAHGLLLTRGVPVSVGWFLALAAVLVVQLWAEQEYFHYFFMPAFAPCTTRGRRAVYILSESLARGIAFGLAFIPVLSSPLHPIGRVQVIGRFYAVPAIMIGGFLIFLPIAFLAFYARRRGYNVLAPCLALALSVALVFSCFLSSRAF